MRIVHEKPPNYDVIAATFDLRGKDPLFTYGDIIFNPGGNPVDSVHHRHEEVHMRQQGTDPAAWWKRYLEDPAFRYEQELEAYRAQYQAARMVRKYQHQLMRLLRTLATDLASPMYGSVCTVSEAMDRISKP